MDEEIKNPWETVVAVANAETRSVSETSRLKMDNGWLYRVSTEHRNASGIVTACSEALSFVPNKQPSTKR